MSHSASSLTIDFSQKSQCTALLRTLNPTDSAQACGVLKQLLDGMKNQPPEPVDHLQLLEDIRSTLSLALEQAVQRYASHPLPPSSMEDEVLREVVGLWQGMADNYEVVGLRSTFDTSFAKRRSLLAQRRMLYTTHVVVEYFRARRELPKGLWYALHGQFIEAERAGAADVRVPDPLNETWGAQSALEAYITILLIDAAGPYNRTPREFAWVVRWAQRFAPYCSLQQTAENQPSMYALEMGVDRGLLPSSLMDSKHHARGLGMAKLASHIRGIVTQLKKGVAANSLGLGDDCVQPACARLLVSLYRLWGMAAAGRKFPRRPARGKVQLLMDPRGMAFFIDKREFVEPEDIRSSNFSNTQTLQLFGQREDSLPMSDAELQERAAQIGYMPETWSAIDQSVTGCRLIRSQPGSRVEHRQAIGLCRPGGEGILLAEICWLQYKEDGTLHAGVHIMVGRPQVVALRRVSIQKDRFQLGFLLTAPNIEPSLIVPMGWYTSDRVIEVKQGSTSWSVAMTKLLSRGSNFDRVSFSRE